MNRLGTNQARRGFRGALLKWYGRERRELPWRQTSDPYRIWVSEIMLQQTRVAAVVGHYHRFVGRYPSVDALAGARLDQVLAVWSGLGYYRRARSLHAAARRLLAENRGQLPRTSEDLRSLPGIGRYTAAAIASIAFGEPVAVVDGNVERVLSRVYGRYLSRIQAWETAGELLDRGSPGDFNQAMMELGAGICVPGEPDCGRCPVVRWCATRGHLARQGRAARRKAEVTFRLAQRDGRVLLVQRPKTASLMPEMWELPAAGRVNGNILFQLRHAITTTDYSVAVVAANSRRSGARGRWVRKQELSRLPLTGLARKILRRAALLKNPITDKRRRLEQMPALEAGTEAPAFALPSMDGRDVSLQDALRRGPVVAAFFKISCPVCQFTFPFLERLHRAYKGRVAVLGVSQNPKADTAAFLKEYGVTFTTLLDDPAKYAVSNAYGLTNVPTIFLIGQGGEVEQTIVGWDRKDMENLNARLADLTREAQPAIFRPGEQIPDFKAG